jgi:tetratricopeptide (TPR) repeat protein
VRAVRPAFLVAAVAVVLLVAGYVAYLVRHLIFVRDVQRAEAALAAGEHETARTLLSPLLAQHGDLPLVQRAAGRTLYEMGDPLSAAALLERAARSFADDSTVAATLVASYAALNRGGDARRAAALLPRHPDVRLALGWSELVALGGDRVAGSAIAEELRDRADVISSASRRAMSHLLSAIAHARAKDPVAGAEIERAASARDGLPPDERAFLLYLEGVALRELGRRDDAILAWERAMEAAPTTIGEALATRERANMLAAQPSSSGQPSADSRSSEKVSGS